MNKKKVIVGMSGGVDSSVAALLLKKKGYDVIGIFMKNWNDIKKNGEYKIGNCTANKDFNDVLSVANCIGIPCYNISFVKEYWNYVVKYFLNEYSKYRTPNPDIMCNKKIKFGVFLKFAFELNADYVATGHYARIGKNNNGNLILIKAIDCNKDQTYFLSQLSEKQLSKILFPLGNLKKKNVRLIAKKNLFINANKKDSSGVCFIGEKQFNIFLNKYLGFNYGYITTINGEKKGIHKGLMYYTIGQRKGLKIGSSKNDILKEPWFVIGKNCKKNVLYVGQGFNNKFLYSTSADIDNINLITKDYFIKETIICDVKIRHQKTVIKSFIKFFNNKKKAKVFFSKPIRAVTPGQLIAFYKKNNCIGSGFIFLVYRNNKLLPYI